MSVSLQAIGEWFRRPIARTLSNDDLLETYHRLSPSKVFLRTLPIGATVLDMGAGDGSLSIFRSWPSPPRPDLMLYAYALHKGERFDDYDGFEIGDWDQAPPAFDGMQFDAVMAVNFLEHIADPKRFLAWAIARLNPRGRLYLEWPTARAQYCPTLPELAGLGFGCIIGNYFDDPTHQWQLPTTDFTITQVRNQGLHIESAGEIRMPLMADELLGHYRETGDLVSLQFAYWLRTGWIQNLVASVPEPLSSLEQEEHAQLRRRIAEQRPPSHEAFAERMRAGNAPRSS